MKQNSNKVSSVTPLLNKYLLRIRENNPSYSNRAFARDVGLSPAFASDILNGKKPLPFKHVKTFIRVLDMDQADAAKVKQSYVPEGIRQSTTKSTKDNQQNWKLANRAQLKILSQWYYLPMLDLCTCEGFQGNFRELLGITSDEENDGVQTLLDLGLIKKSKNGDFQKTNVRIHFTSAKSKAEFRKYHGQMLKKSLLELENTDEQRFLQRLIFGFSLALNSKGVAHFKKQLSDLIYQSIDEMNEDSCDQVYHLGLQFYPLSGKTTPPPRRLRCRPKANSTSSQGLS